MGEIYALKVTDDPGARPVGPQDPDAPLVPLERLTPESKPSGPLNTETKT
jgi:hypothetical protein